MEDPRLERIEKKLDEMAQAVISLARVEERLNSHTMRIDKLENTRDENRDRIDTLENHEVAGKATLGIAERLFWIAATAGITYLVVSLGGMI